VQRIEKKKRSSNFRVIGKAYHFPDGCIKWKLPFLRICRGKARTKTTTKSI